MLSMLVGFGHFLVSVRASQATVVPYPLTSGLLSDDHGCFRVA